MLQQVHKVTNTRDLSNILTIMRAAYHHPTHRQQSKDLFTHLNHPRWFQHQQLHIVVDSTIKVLPQLKWVYNIQDSKNGEQIKVQVHHMEVVGQDSLNITNSSLLSTRELYIPLKLLTCHLKAVLHLSWDMKVLQVDLHPHSSNSNKNTKAWTIRWVISRWTRLKRTGRELLTTVHLNSRELEELMLEVYHLHKCLKYHPLHLIRLTLRVAKISRLIPHKIGIREPRWVKISKMTLNHNKSSRTTMFLTQTLVVQVLSEHHLLRWVA